MPMNVLKAEQRVRRIAAELPRSPGDARRIAGIEQAVRRLLLGGVMPLWLGAGLADWYLHRRTRIEETSGARESAIHVLLFAQAGVPVLLGLFCEVNAGVLATAYGAAAAHSATAYWDQAYAEERRRVSPVEQHVHSLLEVSPLTAALLLTPCTGTRPPRWPEVAVTRGSVCAPSAGTRCHRESEPACWPRSASPGYCPTPRSSGAAGGRTRPQARSPGPPPRLRRRCGSRPRALPPNRGRVRPAPPARPAR